MKWLALDIGGANLKLAHESGYAASRAFPLWSRRDQLSAELRMMIAEAPSADRVVVTITGELADCFESRGEGIRHIVQAVDEVTDGRHARVYLLNGKMVTPQVAVREPLLAAASNWHALARFAGRYAPDGTALLIDVGSTTCDLLPLSQGESVHQGVTDTERLVLGELVYSGVERTPVCALVDELPYRGDACPVAREVFATTRDVYLLLGDLPEQATDGHTADGRPATRGAARSRMSRMICAMDGAFHHRDAVVMAEAVAAAQCDLIIAAARRVIGRLPAPPIRLISSGQGEFVAQRVFDALSSDFESSPQRLSLARQLGPSLSRVAPAFALVTLAREAQSP